MDFIDFPDWLAGWLAAGWLAWVAGWLGARKMDDGWLLLAGMED